MGKDLKGKELGPGLSQRKDGRYIGRFTTRAGDRHCVYGTDVKKVRAEMAELKKQDEAGFNLKPDMKLNDWYVLWMDTYKKQFVQPGTIRIYENTYVKHIKPYIGNYQLRDITRLVAQKRINQLAKEGYSYDTIQKVRIMIQDLLEKAVQEDILVRNPCRRLLNPKTKDVKAFALTLEDEKEFLRCSAGSVYENLFYVVVNTGLRLGEAVALTQNDIDYDKRIIHVTKSLNYAKNEGDKQKCFHIGPPKHNSVRDVPINDDCLEHLLKQAELKNVLSNKNPREQNDYLFVTKYNTPINAAIIDQIVDTIRCAINDSRSTLDEIPKFGMHALRHTFATRCYENGVPLKVIQKYLGHKTLQMTADLYTHVTQETAEQEISKLPVIKF